jgi:hypothetical protein
MLCRNLANLVFRQRLQLATVRLPIYLVQSIHVLVSVPNPKTGLERHHVAAADEPIALRATTVNRLGLEPKSIAAILRANRKEVTGVVNPSSAAADTLAILRVSRSHIGVNDWLDFSAELRERLEPFPSFTLGFPGLLGPQFVATLDSAGIFSANILKWTLRLKPLSTGLGCALLSSSTFSHRRTSKPSPT